MIRNLWWLPGAALIVFGLLIFIYPELLAFIVATAFIGVGVTMLSVGRGFRQAMRGQVTSYRMYTSQQRPPNQVYYD